MVIYAFYKLIEISFIFKITGAHTNGEPDHAIQFVVSDFKSKYGIPAQPTENKPGLMDKILNNPIVKGLEKIGGAFQKTGEVLLNPTINALQTGIMQPIRKVQEIVPGGKTGHEVYQTPFGENKNVKDLSLGQKIMQPIDVLTVGLPVENLVKTPLTKIAETLYQKALKPGAIKVGGKVVTSAEEIAKIGLNEGVWLTKGGVERVATKIDNFENMLGDAINKAQEQGAKISTDGLKTYLNEAKNFFSNQFNVEESKKAIQEIDSIGKEFIKKYGKEIPIEKAQEIKVATGQALRKYYDRMSSAGIEGTKQGVRYLKDKIVEKAPVVGNINARLSNLYKFDQALQKATGRIGNLNLLGLPSKIGGAVAGPSGALAGKLMELLDAPSVKSGLAIGLDKLATGGQTALKGVKIPLANLITYIVDEINSQEMKK